MAIISEHPSAILELLAYMLTIIKASQQYDGLYWQSYDTYAASGNRALSRLNTDLYTRFLTSRAKPVSTCSSVSHLAANCQNTRKFAPCKKKALQLWLPSIGSGSLMCAQSTMQGALMLLETDASTCTSTTAATVPEATQQRHSLQDHIDTKKGGSP